MGINTPLHNCNPTGSLPASPSERDVAAKTLWGILLLTESLHDLDIFVCGGNREKLGLRGEVNLV